MESQFDTLVLEFIQEGPKKRKKIEEQLKKDAETDFTPRTLTNVLNRLQEKQLIKKIGRGMYAPITHITHEEAITNIRRAIDLLSLDYYQAPLTKISRYAMIPESWTFRKGEVEISFEDLVFAELRRRVREDDESDEEIHILLVGDRLLERTKLEKKKLEKKRFEELDEEFSRSQKEGEREEGGEKRE